MFAPGHTGGGDDLWINGMRRSQWYAKNPSQKPTEYFDENHVGHPVSSPVAPLPEPDAVGDPTALTAPIAPPQGAIPPTPTVPGLAAPVAADAPRNPIYSNMATQLSPTTMTALSGYGQSKKKRPWLGPFSRTLF